MTIRIRNAQTMKKSNTKLSGTEMGREICNMVDTALSAGGGAVSKTLIQYSIASVQ